MILSQSARLWRDLNAQPLSFKLSNVSCVLFLSLLCSLYDRYVYIFVNKKVIIVKTLGKTVVIAVRVPEKIKRDIEQLGFKVSVFVKEAIEEELRRRRSEEAMRWIQMNRVPGKEIGFDSVKVIRQMRTTM